MNPALLLAHFSRITDPLDTIPRLRRFIRDLAVRGKLVEQDPADESPEELSNFRNKNIGHVEGLPHSWVRGKVGKLLNFQYGKGLPANTRQTTGPVPVFGSNGVVGYSIAFLTKNPAIIIGRKGSAGALNLCPGPSWTTDVAYFVEPPPFLDLRFLFLELQTLNLDQLGKGVKPGLSRSDAYDLDLVVPPLAEQSRIVSKIDELMELCDRLEAQQHEREERRDRLAAASHHYLNNGAEVFHKHARFFLGHLPRLTTRPDQIKQLRQTILSLAACGQLVPQDPNDEPASTLLLRIAKDRAKLLDEGYPNPSEARTQLQKQRKQCLPEGLRMLPRGWQWATLIQGSALVVDCHNKTAPYSRAGVILLRTTNVRDGQLNLNEPKFVDEPTYERWSARCRPEPGDILITREAPMGEVCIVPPGMKICLGQRMMLARLVPNTIDPTFMLYSLRDPNLMDRVQDKPVGATVQHLRVGGVETLLVAVPPLAEQHRIVAKVNELMSLCDRLESQLMTTQAGRHRLLEAVLHHSLSSS